MSRSLLSSSAKTMRDRNFVGSTSDNVPPSSSATLNSERIAEEGTCHTMTSDAPDYQAATIQAAAVNSDLPQLPLGL